MTVERAPLNRRPSSERAGGEIVFRCRCGGRVPVGPAACVSCGRRYLAQAGVLDFVHPAGALAEEREHYDARYRHEAGEQPGILQDDVDRPWRDAWHPVHRRLLERMQPLEGRRVLLLGNGDSIKEAAFLAARPASVVWSDLSAVGTARVRDRISGLGGAERCTFAAINALELPLFDGSLDRVYGYAMAHHLPSVEPLIREVLRVLAPGGRAVFFDCAFSPAWHLAKTTMLAPLRRFSHRRSGISPEDRRFSDLGGFRESELAAVAEAHGGAAWFHRCGCLTRLWWRGAEKLLPRRLARWARPQPLGALLAAIDAGLSRRVSLYYANCIPLAWGLEKRDVS